MPKWMKAAIILALSFFLAIWLVKPVGVSTQFSVLSGIIHTAINPCLLYTSCDYCWERGGTMLSFTWGEFGAKALFNDW